MGARLEFRILGPLEVRRDGAIVPVGGPRQRALLALLLCNANGVVARERLIDELLTDQPADSAAHALRVQVSRLRKALAVPGEAPRLLARSGGYVLRIEDGELDLQAFEQRVTNGRNALEQGDPKRAAVLLREAERLWRGRPLADLEFDPLARFEVQRLEELRLLAIEERIEAELALGRHAASCPELEALVAEHPMRERLRGQLMLALYRSGRQAEARESYRSGRSLLVGELAVEPGPQLRRLERGILQQDTALNLDSSQAASPSAASRTERAGTGTALATAATATEEPALSPGRHLRPARWFAGALAVAAAILIALATVPQLGSSARRMRLTGNLLALVSPGSGVLMATIPLAAAPSDLAFGFGSLWVAEPAARAVVRVDPTRGASIATIPVGSSPGRVLTAAGQVWVLDPVDGTLSRIDPTTDTVAQTIVIAGNPSDLAWSAGSLRSRGGATAPWHGSIRSPVARSRSSGPAGIQAA